MKYADDFYECKIRIVAAAQVPSSSFYKGTDLYTDIRTQTNRSNLRSLVGDLGLAEGAATLHAVVALGKFAFFAFTRADGEHGALRLGGWQQTCFGHVPFATSMEATFERKLQEGPEVVERWLLHHSPFVYPYGRTVHGNDQEYSQVDELNVLPIWTSCMIIKVSVGGSSVTIPVVFGGGDFKNERVLYMVPSTEIL